MKRGRCILSKTDAKNYETDKQEAIDRGKGMREKIPGKRGEKGPTMKGLSIKGTHKTPTQGTHFLHTIN